MFADLRQGGWFLVRFDVTPDEFINPALSCSYWHCPAPLSVLIPVTENKFSLTTENRTNILEHMRRDVKRFLSHRGFSPVINVCAASRHSGSVGRSRMAANLKPLTGLNPRCEGRGFT